MPDHGGGAGRQHRWEQKKHMNHKGLEENVYCISWDVPADPAAEKRTCRFRCGKNPEVIFCRQVPFKLLIKAGIGRQACRYAGGIKMVKRI